ncbi:MAG: glycosyl transferase, group 2 family protein [Xanthobacteraceae bacterium]|nr:glycosyl transferase, group 2 family protein [Xanthobacteraceae bacterium]
MTANPIVSVLITTYNRSRLLRRAIDSVLMQDFTDFEIVIIDDCSTDDTTAVVASYNDPRIRYLRNETNVGSQLGDRAILRRFIYELMRGKYWVYLCDDDYWLFPDLLRRQVDAFSTYDDVVMVVGGQLSYFLTTPDSYFGRSSDDTMTFTLDNIDTYFDRATLKPKTHHLYFMRSQGLTAPLFSKTCMSPEEFLAEFAEEPAGKNIIGGAMLYSREHFIKSGALLTSEGSQWQAGYELKLGPACFGKTVYFDEPSIVSEIRQSNASFQRTQVEHYLDSIFSVELAFQVPLTHPELAEKRTFLNNLKKRIIRKLTAAYLSNTLTILRNRELTLCSERNIAHPVTLAHVWRVMMRHRMYPGTKALLYGILIAVDSKSVRRLRALWPALRIRLGALPLIASGQRRYR